MSREARCEEALRVRRGPMTTAGVTGWMAIESISSGKPSPDSVGTNIFPGPGRWRPLVYSGVTGILGKPGVSSMRPRRIQRCLCSQPNWRVGPMTRRKSSPVLTWPCSRLVFAALHVEKSFVQAEKSEAQG